MARLASLLPRFVALPVIALLATAAVTFAAEKQLAAPQAPSQQATAPVPTVLTVPDVRRQAYVFAKGTLEDEGFAWRVVGPVQGHAANLVASQSPAPGTRVLDTGSPTIQLTLKANTAYRHGGSPENASPYAGSAIELPGRQRKPAAAPALEQPEQAAPAVAPKPAAKPKAAAKPKKKTTAKAAERPRAFAQAGTPAEPLDEMPLPDRARALARYIAAHPKPTNEVVNHFLYQHSWIVAGARFGWWRGAEALELLIQADRQAQASWGIGAKSERVARRSLAWVRSQSR